MAAGFDFLLKRGDGASPEVFTTVGALRTKALTIDGNPVDATTDDDADGNNVVWRVFEGGVHGFEITASGVAKTTNKTTVQAVYNDFATNAVTNYQVVVPIFGTWSLPVVIGSMTINGAYDDIVNFDITIQANGAPTFVAET
jgi:predicted secreted protein